MLSVSYVQISAQPAWACRASLHSVVQQVCICLYRTAGSSKLAKAMQQRKQASTLIGMLNHGVTLDACDHSQHAIVLVQKQQQHTQHQD